MTVTVYPFDNSPIPNELGWRNTAGRPYLSGVYAKELNEFICTSSVLTITVGTGRAGAQGTYMESTATIARTVSTNASNANPRIDYLVLRLDRGANTMLPLVIQGTPASTPAPPALTITDTLVDIPLYQARLNANGTSIASLTDVRQYAPYSDKDGTGFSKAAWVFESSNAVGTRGIRTKQGADGALEIVTTAAYNPNAYIAFISTESSVEAGRFDVLQGSLRVGGAVNMTNAKAGVLGLSDIPAALGGNPTSGVYLYADSGALKCRGSSGTVTTLAPP